LPTAYISELSGTLFDSACDRSLNNVVRINVLGFEIRNVHDENTLYECHQNYATGAKTMPAYNLSQYSGFLYMENRFDLFSRKTIE
jgi:hypothetical protein